MNNIEMDIINSVIQLVTSIILLSATIIPLVNKSPKNETTVVDKQTYIAVIELFFLVLVLVGIVFITIEPLSLIGYVLSSLFIISYWILFFFKKAPLTRHEVGNLVLLAFLASINISNYRQALNSDFITKMNEQITNILNIIEKMAAILNRI